MQDVIFAAYFKIVFVTVSCIKFPNCYKIFQL